MYTTLSENGHITHLSTTIYRIKLLVKRYNEYIVYYIYSIPYMVKTSVTDYMGSYDKSGPRFDYIL